MPETFSSAVGGPAGEGGAGVVSSSWCDTRSTTLSITAPAGRGQHRERAEPDRRRRSGRGERRGRGGGVDRLRVLRVEEGRGRGRRGADRRGGPYRDGGPVGQFQGGAVQLIGGGGAAGAEGGCVGHDQAGQLGGVGQPAGGGQVQGVGGQGVLVYGEVLRGGAGAGYAGPGQSDRDRRRRSAEHPGVVAVRDAQQCPVQDRAGCHRGGVVTAEGDGGGRCCDRVECGVGCFDAVDRLGVGRGDERGRLRGRRRPGRRRIVDDFEPDAVQRIGARRAVLVQPGGVGRGQAGQLCGVGAGPAQVDDHVGDAARGIGRDAVRTLHVAVEVAVERAHGAGGGHPLLGARCEPQPEDDRLGQQHPDHAHDDDRDQQLGQGEPQLGSPACPLGAHDGIDSRLTTSSVAFRTECAPVWCTVSVTFCTPVSADGQDWTNAPTPSQYSILRVTV
ncbi:hypothetical protein SXANM310S_03903 [Streptomyces xanthochromogenes]